MFKNKFLRDRFGQIILASASPRRAEIMKQVGFDFRVIPSRIEENFFQSDPLKTATELAFQKAAEVAERFPDHIVIGADTVVYLDDRTLGKPRNETDAAEMLRFLSGKTHQVYTGFAILHREKNKRITDVETTHVTFRKLLQEEIDNYIASGAPLDKAGAYGIQDEGAVFVERIDGDFYNVAGLPVTKIYMALQKSFQNL